MQVGPLNGILTLDFGQHFVGPLVSRILADGLDDLSVHLETSERPEEWSMRNHPVALGVDLGARTAKIWQGHDRDTCKPGLRPGANRRDDHQRYL